MTAEHMKNARKVAKPQDKYLIGKPDAQRKIDLARADTLAHTAASDLHLEGPAAWGPKNALTRAVGATRSY
jgi:hypothetical protein